MLKKGLFASVLIFICILLGLTSKAYAIANKDINELDKMFSNRQYTESIGKGTEFLKNEPDDVYLNMIVGRSIFNLAYLNSQDYKNALPYLEKAIQNDKQNTWMKAWSIENAAVCYYMIGQTKKANEYLDQCISMNSTKNVTEAASNTKKQVNLNSYFDDWKIIKTEHFIFHFHPSFDDKKISKFTKTRETAYSNLNNFFKSNLPKKIDFYVWDSNDSAMKVLGTPLGFALPNLCIVNSRYDQTPGHEMTHVLSYYMYPNVKVNTFINEGTATYFNQLNRTEYIKEFKLRTKFNNNSMKYKYISIVNLWKDGSLFRKAYPDGISYTLGSAFVRHLIKEGGIDKYKEFLQDQTYENAKKVYGEQLNDIVKKFDNQYVVNYMLTKVLIAFTLLVALSIIALIIKFIRKRAKSKVLISK